MDPIEKREKKIAAYEKKALKKIQANKLQKQKESFNSIVIFLVLVGVTILTMLFFLEY